VAVLALGVAGFLHALSTLDSDGEAVLKRWIGGEYQRYQLQRAGLDDGPRAELKSNRIRRGRPVLNRSGSFACATRRSAAG